MKKTLYVLSAILMISFFAQPLAAQKNQKQANLKTFQDSVSYAYGFLIGQQMKEMGDINKELLKKGLDDQYGDKQQITEPQAQSIMQKAQQARQRAEKKKQAEQGKINIAKGKKFLDDNKKKKEVGSTPSGLQYKILTAGKGPKPTAKDKVKVHYEGKLIDGSIFDSSYERGEPATFGLSQVIKGWTEGLQLMNVGSKYRLYIPSDLAYGKRGQRGIPPNSVLVFDVELLEIMK